MNTLQQYLHLDSPPSEFNPYQKALWYEGKDNWDAAHAAVQDLTDEQAAHLHAYLHRKEGDIWNADYWYQQAGRKRPDTSLEMEFQSLIAEYF